MFGKTPRWKERWIHHYQDQGIELRVTFGGFEVKLDEGWTFIRSDAIDAFSVGFSATVEAISRIYTLKRSDATPTTHE